MFIKLKGWIEHVTQIPFADDTGFTGNIDIAIKGDVYDSFDIKALQKELRKYDMDIIEKKRPMDVLILKKKK